MRAETVYFRQTERAFLRSLVGDSKLPGLAPLLGWATWHDRAVNAPRACPHCGGELTYGSNAPGWPDLFLVRDDTLIVAELKSERGRVTDDQRRWLERFKAVRRVVVAPVWRPSMWRQIEQVLK